MKIFKYLWNAITSLFTSAVIPVTPRTSSHYVSGIPKSHKWIVCWGSHTSYRFNEEMVLMTKRFNWTSEHLSWLMACMAFETGKTFSPKIKNMAGSGATGLIQFMPNTALSLGTTVTELRIMSPVSQLRYVEKYFRPYADNINSLNDMYMAILMPKYINYSDDAVIITKGISYRQNSGLDQNKDGRITRGEACYRVNQYWIEGLADVNVAEVTIVNIPNAP